METNNNAPRKRINVQELESKLLYATRQAHSDFQQFKEVNLKHERQMHRMKVWMYGLMLCSLMNMCATLYVHWFCINRNIVFFK